MKYSVLVVALFAAMSAFAGSGNGMAQIEHVGSWSGKSLVFFYTDAHSSVPTCNTYNGRWVIDLSTEEGQSQYSLILSAQMAGKSIKVVGTGDCELWDNSETVHWVGFPPP